MNTSKLNKIMELSKPIDYIFTNSLTNKTLKNINLLREKLCLLNTNIDCVYEAW